MEPFKHQGRTREHLNHIQDTVMLLALGVGAITGVGLVVAGAYRVVKLFL